MSLMDDMCASAEQYLRESTQGIGKKEMRRRLYGEYGERMHEVHEEMERDFINTVLEKVFKRRQERAEGQLWLTNFEIPSAIAFPVNEGRNRWIAFENATKEQAHAHVHVKLSNIRNAQQELDSYEELLRLMREAAWNDQPHLTAGEVLRILRGEMGLDAA